jgi:hypothetical protein
MSHVILFSPNEVSRRRAPIMDIIDHSLSFGGLTCDFAMSRVTPVRYFRQLLATRPIGDGKKNVFYSGSHQ